MAAKKMTLASMSPGEMAEMVARIDYYRNPDPKQQAARVRLIRAICRSCSPAAVSAQAEMEQAYRAMVGALDEYDAERTGEGHFAHLNQFADRYRSARAEYVSLRNVWIFLVAKAV